VANLFSSGTHALLGVTLPAREASAAWRNIAHQRSEVMRRGASNATVFYKRMFRELPWKSSKCATVRKPEVLAESAFR
jgi:hypothetical protein